MFEWTFEYLLKKNKYNLAVILLNNKESELENFLKKNNVPVLRIRLANKIDYIISFIKILKYFLQHKTDIVHTHLFEASFIGLLAARLSGIKCRIHTRHNGTVNHEYYPHAVKYDKLINRLSTDIIAISKIVKNILVDMENVNENKITIIYHGFKLQCFNQVSESRLIQIREKYQIQSSAYPIIGVISRYIHWKGIQYIIPAFIKLKQEYPHAHLILCNANGPYSNDIKKQLSELPSDSYTEIDFESDITALYKVFDIFVHVPINPHSEAFGQVYIESMASGVPLVATLSGIAQEFIVDKKNALVVPFKNSESIYQSILLLLNEKELKNNLINNALKDVQQFSVENMIENLERLYDK